MYQDNLQFKKIRKHDLRRYSRKRCYLPLTRQNGEIETNGSIRDLSLSGLFLETTQIKQPGERLSVKFIIPKNPTPVEFLGEVIHVGSKEGLRVSGMGIRFIELNEVHHKILKNYILDHTFNESLRKFQREFKSTRRNVKPINDSENIFLILSSAATIKAQIDILSPGARDLTSASLIEIHKNEISLCIPPNSIPASLKTHHHLLARLAYNGNHYFFETIITQINNDKLVATFPYSIYFEERRVEKRDSSIPEHSQTDLVEFRLSETENSYMHYKIHDSNSSGLSFICESSPTYLAPGNVLRDLRVKKQTETVEKGDAKVIHISRKNDTQIQVGLQFLLERQSYEFYQINPVERKYTSTFNFLLNKGLSKFFSSIKNIALQKSNPHFSVHLVKYLNRDAEEITAILNATIDLTKQREKVAAPVVIIPPAYARRKETTNLLALTIIESFRKQNKDIVVIRFDGIRSIGESFNDLECQHQNFQMAHYTLSQLVDDIKTTIEFTKNNIYFIPTNLIIVSFSMASVAARRAILLDKDKNITHWISCMGASDPDDLMQNSTGGIDYLKKYQNKESLSVKEVLGHLVDMDRFCNDITSNRMAYLEDSRREMAQINIPVTWIYGKYDYWINENRIKDIMSVKSSSSRRLYEVPYGHIVKNSDEAIRTFKLIAGNIWKHLHQTEIEVSTPSAWYQSAIELSEWSRLKHQKLNSQDYWRSYLLGESSESIGFDIITLTDEYQELMDKQIELLDLKQADRLIDLGGGTGNFAQYFINKIKKEGTENRCPYIIMIDLVHEALLKAREKHRLTCTTNFIRAFQSGYIEANLEFKNGTSRLPIRNESVDKILASLFISYIHDPSPTLKECLRVLKPNGRIVVSSMKPDTDMSKPIHDLQEKIQTADYLPYFQNKKREDLLKSVQTYINSAAVLTDLEEEKYFKFYDRHKLLDLMASCGFRNIQLYDTFGDPPQAIIAIGFK